MSDPLYRKEILRLAADAHGSGRLSGEHVTGHAHNPACGDRITVDLALDRGRIEALGHEEKACVLTQASASILGHALKNVSRADVERLRDAVARMLENTAPPPQAPFDAYAAFAAAAAYPGRHRCVLLPFQAVLAAFDASEAAEPGAMGAER